MKESCDDEQSSIDFESPKQVSDVSKPVHDAVKDDQKQSSPSSSKQNVANSKSLKKKSLENRLSKDDNCLSDDIDFEKPAELIESPPEHFSDDSNLVHDAVTDDQTQPLSPCSETKSLENQISEDNNCLSDESDDLLKDLKLLLTDDILDGPVRVM